MAASSTQNESVHVAGKRAPPVPGAVLVFSGNAPQLRAFTIGEQPLTVDRDTLNLPDPKVSRKHAHIIFDGVGWTVRDLGSKNGTWVQGRKLERDADERATSGWVVRTGSSLFVLYDDVRRFLTGDLVTSEPWVVGPTLKAELDRVAIAARAGRTVLLGGENGAGKEIAAHTYHQASGRKGPFLAKNCAELVPSIADSDLFGWMKGSHSEAKTDKVGLVQAADDGTLFLDEIGELHLEVQAKLLRVIETREVMRRRRDAPRKVDLRIVAATHRDLRRAVETGASARTCSSASRGRGARARRCASGAKRSPPHRRDPARRASCARPDVSLVEAALLRPWPGNVRELISQTKLAAAAAHASGDDAVRDTHLAAQAGLGPERVPSRRPAAAATAADEELDEPAGHHDKETIAAALEANEWVVSKVQRALGIKNRTTLVRLMKKFG